MKFVGNTKRGSDHGYSHCLEGISTHTYTSSSVSDSSILESDALELSSSLCLEYI